MVSSNYQNGGSGSRHIGQSPFSSKNGLAGPNIYARVFISKLHTCNSRPRSRVSLCGTRGTVFGRDVLGSALCGYISL